MAQCQYSHSKNRSRLQKLWAVYLKACGISARAFDAIHSIGVSMSHRWVLDTYAIISADAMNKVCDVVQTSPWHISHDNVNLPMRVFSQRLHNQSHFVSGTAGTVWQLPDHAALPATANRDFNSYRAENSNTLFPYGKLLYQDEAADRRIEAWHVHHILSTLLTSPDFVDYKDRNALALAQPSPTQQLGHGKENVVKQHILGTCTLEEASYDGTMKVIDEFFKQLGLATEVEQKKIAEERFIPWLGDQMTIDRLRGMWNYRHDDHNSFDRMDCMLPVFGWFHLIMTFANSLHKQYLMNSAVIGSLRQAFDVLNRKGLIVQSTKGPFWHNLDEAIFHIAEAHFRACWLLVGGVNDLKDLTRKSPTELKGMALKIIKQHASQEALFEMQSLPVDKQDEVQMQWSMWNRDVLSYIELRHAIHSGDVGRIEDLLPVMAFRFAGGGNSNYTIEILELCQGLYQEWPKEVADHIRKWCWVMTRTGQPYSFLPYDLAQEHNIADIKVHYRSMGPGATMDYLKKISPAIPTLRRVQRHMESEFGTNKRGAYHSAPEKEKDIALLSGQYVQSALHKYNAGRKLKKDKGDNQKDKADKGKKGKRGKKKGSVVDIVNNGAQELETTILDWFKQRALPRSSEEIWGGRPEGQSIGDMEGTEAGEMIGDNNDEMDDLY